MIVMIFPSGGALEESSWNFTSVLAVPSSRPAVNRGGAEGGVQRAGPGFGQRGDDAGDPHGVPGRRDLGVGQAQRQQRHPLLGVAVHDRGEVALLQVDGGTAFSGTAFSGTAFSGTAPAGPAAPGSAVAAIRSRSAAGGSSRKRARPDGLAA
jgi:hypothetical protein